MTYFLKTWKGNNGEHRLYIEGSSRDTIYFCQSKDGSLRASGKANDTPHRFQTGQHYQKVRKDDQAIDLACAAFGLELGRAGDWEKAIEIAASGVGAEDPEHEDDDDLDDNDGAAAL